MPPPGYGEAVHLGGWQREGWPKLGRHRTGASLAIAAADTRALVVLAESAGPVVADCRRRFDPAAAMGMPPHVTVLYPIPTYDATTATALGEALAEHPPFRYDLVALGSFGRVVYLAPEPYEPFVHLTEVAATCLGIEPYGGKFERVVPHVTVAMRRRLPASVRRSLTTALPIAGEAKSVDVLGEIDGRWTVVDSFPLGERVTATL